MSDECGHTWRASWIPPPGVDPVDAAYYGKYRSDERCILPRGHEGDHRSRAKVTAPNHEPGAATEQTS